MDDKSKKARSEAASQLEISERRSSQLGLAGLDLVDRSERSLPAWDAHWHRFHSSDG